MKLESDLKREERLSDWTMEAVCASFPNWMKPMIKEEKILKCYPESQLSRNSVSELS